MGHLDKNLSALCETSFMHYVVTHKKYQSMKNRRIIVRPFFRLSAIWCSILFLSVNILLAQRGIYDSGGILSPEQAAYDVSFYDLTLEVKPDQKWIEGTLVMEADIVQPVYHLVMDLDTLLTITEVVEHLPKGEKVKRNLSRDGGFVWIPLGKTRQPGERIKISISYQGHPKVAPRAPWDGGFSWKQTPSGAHWIATTCQGDGADVWWPCKDHVSDEPDSMALHITVPEPLVVASNGRLQQTISDDGKSTYHWFISTPINIYNVALNIAPYRVLENDFTSVTGETIPVKFWVLPEDYEKGKKLFNEIQAHLKWFEEMLGPYPFRIDKYGVAQTPHLGMEHQTIIAYGANFDNGSMTGGVDWGFDALHQHELGHEWWGNLVTNVSWEDMWIHEGFCTYMQPLYAEYLDGKEKYHEYMRSMRRFNNMLPIAPRKILNSTQIYQAPIYSKGAWVLHTLRYYLGDDDFFTAFRQMAYPNKAMEGIKTGAQCRFATTDDFIAITESVSGKELDWFFDLYCRQAKLPVLEIQRTNSELKLKWQMPINAAFNIPVELLLGKEKKKILIPANGLTLPLAKKDSYKVDPDGWLLCEKKLVE